MTTPAFLDGHRLDLAERLLESAGRRAPFSFSRLAGGKNNQVYRVDTATDSLVLKVYSIHPEDDRDRLGAEYPFCTFAWRNGICCVPRPIASSLEGKLALFEHVPGRLLERDEITREVVQRAADFFVLLNSRRFGEGAAELPEASEACFSIDAHLNLIDKRVDRLRNVEPVSDVDREAMNFVDRELVPARSAIIHSIRSRVMRRDPQGLKAVLTAEDRCLSPSDFGFHNAMRHADGRIIFIDFEYAGWDDPVKTACDFFCQPRYPIPADCWPGFLSAVAGSTRDSAQLIDRVQLLLPAYQLKWCCILLNEFLPAGRHRRLQAAEDESEVAAKWRQLGMARAALSLAASWSGPCWAAA